jgi:hypothetical protein
VACDINDRSRKIHNWKKPSELFTELVELNASTGLNLPRAGATQHNGRINFFRRLA